MSSWIAEWITDLVVASARDLIEATRIGDEVADLDRLNGPKGLARGLDGVVRVFIESQYAPWPSGATTDGINPDLCTRTGPSSLEIVGMCYIDFASEKFPIRIEVRLNKERRELDELTVHIGEVDEAGHPPRFPVSAFILPERDEDGANPQPRLVLKRRPSPITWTKALTINNLDIADIADIGPSTDR